MDWWYWWDSIVDSLDRLRHRRPPPAPPAAPVSSPREVLEGRSLQVTERFFEMFSSDAFRPAERAAILKALRDLNASEGDPRLRIHKVRDPMLPGDLWGAWVEGGGRIRIVYERLPEGRKRALSVVKNAPR